MLANTAKMKDYAPSMKVDYDHGRPLEIQAIYQAVIDRAEQAGALMPLTRMLARQLSFKNAADTCIP